MRHTTLISICAALQAMALSPSAMAHVGGACGGHDEDDDDRGGQRQEAEHRVKWRDPHWKKDCQPVPLQILGFNDFHGQLSKGRLVAGRPVGGAAVMASYLNAATQAFNGPTILAHAGDHVGASPAASALLQDEPSISFLNLLANKHCTYRDIDDPKCNLVGTLGNHEFDEGTDELVRLLYGGNHESGPFLENPWRGARFPYVSANVVDSESGEPILPPYVIKQVAPGVKVGFIGAVLKQTPTIVTPSGVAGLTFLDEATAINHYVKKLRRRGVEAIVVLIHQGGTEASYLGDTDPKAAITGADINGIVANLDSGVDVVISGHSHAFSNALVNNNQGQPILVTQAFSASTAYGDIELSIDPRSGDVIEKSASIVTTWGDAGPGLAPDATVAALVSAAEAKVAPLVNQVVGTAKADVSATANAAGESAMGNLIADAQRAANQTDFAFMNPGGIRAGLVGGAVTWGNLFTAQPFGNSLVKMGLTGAQIYAVLEQQWAGQPFARIMQISGLTYTWDNAKPVGSRIVEVRKSGAPIDKNATYSVTCNNFMAAGGDNFTVFKLGTNPVGGAVDLDALIAFVKGLAQPFGYAIEGRITRLN